MIRSVRSLLAFSCVLMSSVPVWGQSLTPIIPSDSPSFRGRRQGEPQGDEIRALLIKSWSCGGASAWAQLNDEWPAFGDTPIFIDNLGCDDFTYEDLVDSGANVLIVSDSAGGGYQFSPEEIAAVARYADEGHNVIVTYASFWWAGVDNRGLASILGLRSDLAYNDVEVPISNVFQQLDASPCLFRGLADPWTSSGYPFTQVPAETLRWDDGDLAGATIVAQSDDQSGVVTVFRAASYTGIFVSNMPEYLGADNDKQLLYNAITYRPASARSYGDGWQGTLGIPSLQASDAPVLGASLALEIGNSFGLPTMGFLFIGTRSAAIPSAYGGTMLLLPSLVIATPLASEGLSLPVVIPDDPALSGATFFLQVLELDLGATHGVSFTPGLELRLSGC